jgi:hypothetical protein
LDKGGSCVTLRGIEIGFDDGLGVVSFRGPQERADCSIIHENKE